MKKELSPRIQIEQIGQRMEIKIIANKTFATLFLMPVIFILFTFVMVSFLNEARAEAPLWWLIMLLAFIPFLGTLFFRQWLWEYHGKEFLLFDKKTESFTYKKQGSFWIGQDKTWSLSSLGNIHIKGRGFLEGNLRLGLPPFCTLVGESDGNSFQMGDSLSVEDGWRVWMEARKEGFLKDEQFRSDMIIAELDQKLGLK